MANMPNSGFACSNPLIYLTEAGSGSKQKRWEQNQGYSLGKTLVLNASLYQNSLYQNLCFNSECLNSLSDSLSG